MGNKWHRKSKQKMKKKGENTAASQLKKKTHKKFRKLVENQVLTKPLQLQKIFSKISSPVPWEARSFGAPNGSRAGISPRLAAKQAFGGGLENHHLKCMVRNYKVFQKYTVSRKYGDSKVYDFKKKRETRETRDHA